MAELDDNIPEDAIRQRSYEIWLQERCPQGRQQEHWFRAKAELRAERLKRMPVRAPKIGPDGLYFWDHYG